MKNLKDIILEKLKINSKSKIETKYQPKDKDELLKLLDQLIKERGYDGDFNDIDTSKITDMSGLFRSTEFNGDISEWDVSNVKDMNNMFNYSPLEKNPPKWYKNE